MVCMGIDSGSVTEEVIVETSMAYSRVCVSIYLQQLRRG